MAPGPADGAGPPTGRLAARLAAKASIISRRLRTTSAQMPAGRPTITDGTTIIIRNPASA
ncbi:MAG: hypothetical protein AMJ81_00500 [Phycisphaerae bacterium SM23_33]|nr:MAG: hypothetical protein AMJ81_00500 [Phycisphaerae bacterium SM23_33]